MPDKKKLNNKVKALFDERFIKYDVDVVPDVSNPRLTHGNTGMEGEFVYLYVDLRGSSSYTDKHRRQTIAKIYKAFHHCMVETIKEKSGKVRSFDGDRVMGIFDGKRKVNNAVEAAMLMKGIKNDILKPKIKKYYNNDSFDLGIGISLSKTLIIKAGVGYDTNNRDLVSIGTAPNLGAKLSDIAVSPNNIYACKACYSKLLDKNKFTTKNGQKVNMWKSKHFNFSGSKITVYSCSWYRSPK